MAMNEALKACKITTLILDTTYCDAQVRFARLCQDMRFQHQILYSRLNNIDMSTDSHLL